MSNGIVYQATVPTPVGRTVCRAHVGPVFTRHSLPTRWRAHHRTKNDSGQRNGRTIIVLFC